MHMMIVLVMLVVMVIGLVVRHYTTDPVIAIVAASASMVFASVAWWYAPNPIWAVWIAFGGVFSLAKLISGLKYFQKGDGR